MSICLHRPSAGGMFTSCSMAIGSCLCGDELRGDLLAAQAAAGALAGATTAAQDGE